MLLILILLKFALFLSNVVALEIMIQPETIAGQPSLVLWTREPSDGDSEIIFDLRFVRPGPEDVGLAVANVEASPSTQFGTVQVVFPSQGPYQLFAVSGPGYTKLGESNQVTAFAIPLHPTTSVSPTSTSLLPSATTSVHPTPTASGVRHKKNLGAIIGGTLGGVAFLGLLAALVIAFLRRRRHPENKRWTFHRSMMIRPAVLDIRPTSSIVSQSSSPVDIETSPHDDAPSSPVVMIASPSGPRPLLKQVSRPLPIPPGPLKSRQEHILERMKQARNQMMELKKNPGPTQHIMLDDMQKQMSWLQSQIGSPWAMGLTDVTPLGFAHNLAR